MTDHQTMIREVCERLGICIRVSATMPPVIRRNGRWQHFDPVTNYNDTHLLIDWMVAAGWEPYWDHASQIFMFHSDTSEPRSEFSHWAPDFRIAVLIAAWRAVKS